MSKDDIYKDVFICRLQLKEGLNIKSSELEFGSTDGSLGFCRGSRVEGKMSRVEGRGRVYLFVEVRWSRVPCRGSRVEGRGSRVIFITKRRFLF